MKREGCKRSEGVLLFLLGISLQLIPGLGDDPSTPENESKADASSSSESNVGREMFLICLGLGGAVLLSTFLFKYWQKKKREEQQTRLLKLFEEDDELELQLGLQD